MQIYAAKLDATTAAVHWMHAFNKTLDARRLDAGYQRTLDATRLHARKLGAGTRDPSRLDARRLDASRLDATRIDAGRLDARRLDANRMAQKHWIPGY